MMRKGARAVLTGAHGRSFRHSNLSGLIGTIALVLCRSADPCILYHYRWSATGIHGIAMRALCVGRNSFDRSVTRRYGRPAQRQAKDKRKSCGTPRAFFCRCTPVLPFVSLPRIVLFFGRRGHCRSLPPSVLDLVLPISL